MLGGLSWRFFVGLLGIEAGFVLFNIVPTPSATLNLLMELNAESSLPAWFSSMQLFMVALTAFVAWRLDPSKGWRRACWLCMALLFCYLSADEGAAIHERYGASIADQLQLTLWNEPFWVLTFAPLAIITCILMTGLFWRKLRTDKLAFALAAIAISLWLSTFALETAAKWILSANDQSLRVLHRILVLIEEFSEMAGATLLWAATVRWIRKQTAAAVTERDAQRC
jgi:hypothetical protein